MGAIGARFAALHGSLVGCTVTTVGAVAVVLGVAALLSEVNPADCALALQLAGDGSAHGQAMRGPCADVAVTAALWWDMLFLLVYASGLAVICWLGAQALWEGRPRGLAIKASIAAVMAGAADAVENGVLLYVEASGDPGPLWASQAAALVKWVALVPAVAVALAVTVTLVGRLLLWPRRGLGPIPTWPEPSNKAEAAAADNPELHPVSMWRDNCALPPPPTGDEPGRVGICLSGGGIRSATFALGATQALGERGVLAQADYIAAVSGGAYHAGSHQLLRARAHRAGHPVGVADALAAGTPEEDHRRRHGKYIADGATGWAVAVGVVVRNLAMSVALLYAVLLLGARLLGAGYGALRPWAAQLFDAASSPPARAWAWPPFGPGTWAAVLTLAGLALVSWLASSKWPAVWSEGATTDLPGVARWRAGTEALAATALLLAGLAALVLLGGPVLVRFVEWLPHAPFVPDVPVASAATSGGLLGVAVTLWNMLSGGRDDSAAATGKRLRSLASKAEFATRALLSFAVIAGLSLAAVLVLGVELARAVGDYLPAGTTPLALTSDVRLLVPLGALVAAWALLDQTRSMSLHPFYKRRLASSFIIERADDVGAREVDYRLPTLLSEYAAPPSGDSQDSGPQLLICAAANVSGPGLAPPGRRVTPFVFSHDWVGGPRLGYFPTRALERAVAGRAYETDVTTLGAMAMSGAAFASAMGRLGGPFNALLALTNTRLGAWLPNPRYHRRVPTTGPAAHSSASGQASTAPPLERFRRPLPFTRRLPYWVREITGSYSLDDRFVYVTDGGHYENLGLVELLRRGCETIFCIDAGGGDAQGLAHAAALAYEELGVRIEIDGFALAPSKAVGASGDDPVLEQLRGRLARTAVLEGAIVYPDVGPAAGRRGTLHVGRGVLTPAAPFPVLAHALRSESFPSDTTADQWFDVEQFEAYRALGRWVGEQLVPPAQRQTP